MAQYGDYLEVMDPPMLCRRKGGGSMSINAVKEDEYKNPSVRRIPGSVILLYVSL